jgi:hypothetical protein
MMAIFGLIYQNTSDRLCNAYLLDDQSHAGAGLVIASVVIGLYWGFTQLKRII